VGPGMDNNTRNKKVETTSSSKVRQYDNQSFQVVNTFVKKPVDELLTSEGGEDFKNYIDWIGLANDPNLIILSSVHHYYYDSNDLNEAKTIVNIMPLNQIRHVKHFLHTISEIVPNKSHLIGCFMDHGKNYGYFFKMHPLDWNKKTIEKGMFSRIPILNKFYKIIDSRTDNFLSKKNVTVILEELGFKILDITEMKGITYFCTQKNIPVISH
jgi:hypothetical protein